MNTPFVCSTCRHSLRITLLRNVSLQRAYTRPSFAPKPTLNLKHIRQNPGLYEQNCIDRNYGPYAKNGWRILELHDKTVSQQRETVELRQRNNVLSKELKGGAGGKSTLVDEARELKGKLVETERQEKAIQEEMERLKEESQW